jgi:hypothetical protein
MVILKKASPHEVKRPRHRKNIIEHNTGTLTAEEHSVHTINRSYSQQNAKTGKSRTEAWEHRPQSTPRASISAPNQPFRSHRSPDPPSAPPTATSGGHRRHMGMASWDVRRHAQAYGTAPPPSLGMLFLKPTKSKLVRDARLLVLLLVVQARQLLVGIVVRWQLLFDATCRARRLSRLPRKKRAAAVARRTARMAAASGASSSARRRSRPACRGSRGFPGGGIWPRRPGCGRRRRGNQARERALDPGQTRQAARLASTLQADPCRRRPRSVRFVPR